MHHLSRLTAGKLGHMIVAQLRKCDNHTDQSLSVVYLLQEPSDCREGYGILMAHHLRARRVQKKPSDCIEACCISQTSFPEPSIGVWGLPGTGTGTHCLSR